ncbi:RecQ family ATP-dependent DNA helicase [Pectobacterium atrosepticum]|uniref:RecQ family ATP-dependent DNA helicase n=1 Tax=Pectobacterium atrosepticum TaxID=29471 RepID=UPI000C294C4A|nr:RecQ family ATP-dependent DNA helicase [Pectobacterium atrosepticum]ATY89866.1 ATP-dependent DNA helicase RecG [Pectobacterium atrosepticum]MCA6980422.1 RecQ family ATP-dependent DNA helicase [Pectobacterium atrosepticum]MCH5021598.1 RecQ family ATP-dependent DNA helicase [Pectobacterium atrosepticum]
MIYDPKVALELLRNGSGKKDSVFRDNQEEAIRYVVEGKGRLLVVQKTGWGKSFVYFIATKLLRMQGAGPALLISPLLSLMRNQIAAASKMGVVAATINSDNIEDWKEIENRIIRGEVDIILISPERLANERFRSEVLSEIAAKVSLIVVDEAHCISDWGHDFRPHYRLLERIVKSLPPNLRILATTATANNRVMQDLTTVLGPNLYVSKGDLNRPSLTLQTIKLKTQAERLAWLSQQLALIEGSGIIYTLTIRDANQVTSWLQSKGFNVAAYTGQTGDQREELEDALINNQVKALIATTALGMGYDKPDLSFVIHYQMPGSVVAYYQQVGRAGRALDSAYGILLSGEEELTIADFFISNSFPEPKEVKWIIEALENEKVGLSVPELLSRLNISKSRIEKTISLLSLESPAPIVKEGSKWQLTTSKVSDIFWQRAKNLTNLRYEELEQMQKYVDLPFGRHMHFLIEALDGEPRNIRPPCLPELSSDIHPALLEEALTFLNRSAIPIAPRQKWPAGGMPKYGIKGNIPANLQANSGIALSIWGDAGWGAVVKHERYTDRCFSERLVQACAEMILKWDPKPSPTWITAIPSLKNPLIVPDFARSLAKRLNLPFHMVLSKAEDRPEQKSMANSTQQARNLDGSLAMTMHPPKGPVLLIDDIVNSRWTLTVASWLLRQNGSGEILPVVLSYTGNE